MLCKGRAPLGALIEIRESESGERAVVIDGARVDHYVADLPIQSPLEFGDSLYEETFGAPSEAIDALAAFVHGAAREAPWRWATALHADGIIDPTFALTERGRRLFSRSASRGSRDRRISRSELTLASSLQAGRIDRSTNPGSPSSVPSSAVGWCFWSRTRPQADRASRPHGTCRAFAPRSP